MTRSAPVTSALIALCLLGGCATPGALHVYWLETGGGRAIADYGAEGVKEGPSHLAAKDRVVGFAYDPFTDHFFLRLEPGNRIRVVDRPARAIKREFEVAGPNTRGGGDLAIRPRDGHLFLLGSTPGSVVETTRLGKFIRGFTLTGVSTTPVGIAVDPARDRLLVLDADGRGLTVHDRQGERTGGFTLAEPAGPSLAFDGERREIYAPLRDRHGEIGVFDETGRLLRTCPATGTMVDVGARSFLRVF